MRMFSNVLENSKELIIPFQVFQNKQRPKWFCSHAQDSLEFTDVLSVQVRIALSSNRSLLPFSEKQSSVYQENYNRHYDTGPCEWKIQSSTAFLYLNLLYSEPWIQECWLDKIGMVYIKNIYLLLTHLTLANKTKQQQQKQPFRGVLMFRKEKTWKCSSDAIGGSVVQWVNRRFRKNPLLWAYGALQVMTNV